MYSQALRTASRSAFRVSAFAAPAAGPISTTSARMGSTDTSHATGSSAVPGKIQEKAPKAVEDALPDSVRCQSSPQSWWHLIRGRIRSLQICWFADINTLNIGSPYRRIWRSRLRQQDPRKGRRCRVHLPQEGAGGRPREHRERAPQRAAQHWRQINKFLVVDNVRRPHAMLELYCII